MISITNPLKFGGTLIVMLGIFLLIVWGIMRLVLGGSDILESGDFKIESGTSARAVWKNLEEEGYVSSSSRARYAAWRQDVGSNIKAGTYVLEAGEDVREVVQRFAHGDTQPDEFTITYPEGFTLQQIAERTAARGIGTEESFIAAASDPAVYAAEFPFLSTLPAGRTLEGYLFPDTYKVFPDDTPEDVIKRMLATFDRRAREAGIPQAAQEANRTVDQLVIMASIVEREVISDADMALVAGVLWKRNDEDIGLYADATTRYILNKWDGALTVGDLAIDSPYNTRKYKGLTPGPISNPGLRALTAAARPEESEYYYYLSALTGETIFARTNDEHNRNKVEYLQ